MLFPGRAIVYTAFVSLLILLASLGLEAHAQTTNTSPGGDATLREPLIPAPIEEVLYTREFELEAGYRLGWPPDTPPVSSGTIVVIRADLSLTVPRQVPTPILYAGDRVVHVLNSGRDSGVLIGIVPETGTDRLVDQPVWFGPPRQPGTIDDKTIADDRRAALAAGIRPNTEQEIMRVNRDPVRSPDLATLLRGEIADLVLEFAPKERSLAAKWRLPDVGELKGGLERR